MILPTIALIAALATLAVNAWALHKSKKALDDAERYLAEARASLRLATHGKGQPVNHKRDAPAIVLTSEQWRTMYNAPTPEHACREMAEQEAETRDARRDRAMNRARGRTGTDEEAHVQADKE